MYVCLAGPTHPIGTRMRPDYISSLPTNLPTYLHFQTESITDPSLAHLLEGGTYITAEGMTTEDFEMVLDKIRREVTRAYVEMLQVGR